MPLTNTPKTYGFVTKAFHWTTALLILLLIPLGAIANDLPYETSEELARKAFLFSIHKTLGVLVFAVALARILWAVSQYKPASLHSERKVESFAAEVVHWTLYGSLVVVPLSGWIHHAATTGFAPIWLPIGQNLPFVPKSESVAHWFGLLHSITTKVLIASVVLHIAGALKHHFIDKDVTLKRMWFGRTDVPDLPMHRTRRLAPVVAIAAFVGSGALASVLIGQDDAEAVPTVALEQTASEWVVQDGTLAITVTQLGSDVTGRFADWTADISFDEAAGPDFGEVSVTVAIGSLTLGSVTDQAMGADYFDAATFPTATFAGPIVADGDGYKVDGTLTIRDAEVPLSLPFTLDMADGVATVSGAATTDRIAFGIGEGQTDEGTLGFDVGIAIDLTATRDGA